MRKLAGWISLTTLALVAVPGPASAGPSAEPGASLVLTWSAPDVSRQVFTAHLTCAPDASDQAEHDASAACAQIATAGGDFTALPGFPVDCSHYQGWRIRTTATGTWSGAPVRYDVLHANICEARKATGAVIFVW
jgi:hypothetical protein